MQFVLTLVCAIKGIVHNKIKILSFTHSHVISADFLSSEKIYFEETLASIDLHSTYTKSLFSTFLKISSFVLHRTNSHIGFERYEAE